MYVSRTAQVLVTVIILGLDAFVIYEWNKNQLKFYSLLSTAASAQKLSINSYTWGEACFLLAMSCLL